MPELNPWPILVATLAGFAIGGFWYSPALFGRVWQRAAGLTDQDLARRSPALIFGGAFVLILVAAAELAMFLGEGATLAWGLGAGALTAVWVACALGVLYLFERRPVSLFLVNAGYWLVTFVAMGGILALW